MPHHLELSCRAIGKADRVLVEIDDPTPMDLPTRKQHSGPPDPSSVLKQPGERHFEPLGQHIPSITTHTGVNWGAGYRRCKGHESEPRGDDFEPEHVKPIAHQEHSATRPTVEPPAHLC